MTQALLTMISVVVAMIVSTLAVLAVVLEARFSRAASDEFEGRSMMEVAQPEGAKTRNTPLG